MNTQINITLEQNIIQMSTPFQTTQYLICVPCVTFSQNWSHMLVAYTCDRTGNQSIMCLDVPAGISCEQDLSSVAFPLIARLVSGPPQTSSCSSLRYPQDPDHLRCDLTKKRFSYLTFKLMG